MLFPAPENECESIRLFEFMRLGEMTMKIYIALGGIGCRTLKDFAREQNIERDRCYYIDSDPYTFERALDKDDHAYWVEGVQYGTGAMRAIGRNVIRHAIYSGKLDRVFSPAMELPGSVELVFVTTSFGGFGSAAVVEMADYLQSKFWHRLDRSAGRGCTVIALNEAYWPEIGFPLHVMKMHAMNTLQLLSEMESRAPIPKFALDTIGMRGMFLPETRFFLVCTSGMKDRDFWRVLEMPEQTLQELDCREQYRIKPQKRSPAVFISYSTEDQAIADMLVRQLEEKGIGCWIANKSIDPGSYAKQIMRGIRETKIFAVLISRHSIASPHVKNEIDRAFARLNQGMKIMPLILDDAPLDEECEYYLCRQEMYFGQRPPLEKRIQEFAQRISDTLE